MVQYRCKKSTDLSRLEKAKELAVGITNASPKTIKTAKKYLARKKKKK